VQRRTAEQDLRRGLVSISRKGQTLIQAALPSTIATNAEIERLYGAERMKQLLRLLIELEEALGGAQPAEE
jgi:DNA-binding MarR family transcriptional regulator